MRERVIIASSDPRWIRCHFLVANPPTQRTPLYPKLYPKLKTYILIRVEGRVTAVDSLNKKESTRS